jgi:hypothetical protein
MARLYAVFAWAIIALGSVHMAATWRLFDAVSSRSLWFFMGGIAAVLHGAINLLNRAYGVGAPGLLWVCRATNIVMLAFGIVMALTTKASALSFAFVVGSLAALTAFSFLFTRPRGGS